MSNQEWLQKLGFTERERVIGGELHWRTKEGTWRAYTPETMAERQRVIERAMEMERVAAFKDDK